METVGNREENDRKTGGSTRKEGQKLSDYGFAARVICFRKHEADYC